MILTGILTLLYYGIIILFGIFPTGGTLPTAVHNAAYGIGGDIYAWNLVFPVDVVVNILLLSFTVAIIYLSFRVIIWVIATLRGSGVA